MAVTIAASAGATAVRRLAPNCMAWTAIWATTGSAAVIASTSGAAAAAMLPRMPGSTASPPWTISPMAGPTAAASPWRSPER